MIFSLIASVFFLAGPGATPSFASDYQSPRAAALGGAGHAAPLLNDAIYLNPSYSAFLQSYSVGVSYQNYYGTETGLGGGRLYNVSIQDGRSPLFQAGLGYTVREGGAMVHLGASRIVAQRVSVGLGTKFMIPSDASRRGAQELSLSATAIPLPYLILSIQGENLVQSNASLEHRLQREFVLGTKLTIENLFAFYADPHFTPILGDPWGYEMGAELLAFKDVTMRAGLFQNANVGFVGARTRGFSAGVGWAGPRLSIDYAFTRSLGSAESPDAFTHAFGATMYF